MIDQAALRDLALANPHMSVDDLTLLYGERHEIKITGNTARSYLKKMGVERVRIKRRPAASSGGSDDDGPKRYGYSDAHRDEGDDQRYPGTYTDADCAEQMTRSVDR